MSSDETIRKFITLSLYIPVKIKKRERNVTRLLVIDR